MTSPMMPTPSQIALTKEIAFLQASIDGFRNYTILSLAYAVNNATSNHTTPIDVTPILTGVANPPSSPPTNPFLRLRKLVDRLGGPENARAISQAVLPTVPHDVDSPDNLNPVAYFMILITTIFVVVRISSRWIVTPKMRPTDILLIIGLLLSHTYTGLSVLSTYYGSGYHLWDISYNTYTKNVLITYISEVIYWPTLLFIKLSLLTLYYDLATNSHSRLREYIVGVGVFALTSTIAVTMAVIFQAQPIDYWNHLHDGTVRFIHREVMYYIAAAMGILTDWVILLLPSFIVLKLNLKLGQKIGVILLFGLGGVVCIGSILRLSSLKQFLHTDDITFDQVNTGVWSILEIDLAIICACIPASKALVIRLGSKLKNRLSQNKMRSTTDTLIQSPSRSSKGQQEGYMDGNDNVEMEMREGGGKKGDVRVDVAEAWTERNAVRDEEAISWDRR